MNLQKLQKINRTLGISIISLIGIEVALVAIMLMWDKLTYLAAGMMIVILVASIVYLIITDNIRSKIIKPSDMTHEERIRSINEAIRVVSHGSNKLRFDVDGSLLDNIGKFDVRLRNPYIRDAFVDLSDRSRDIMLEYLNKELKKESNISEDADINVGNVLFIKDL